MTEVTAILLGGQGPAGSRGGAGPPVVIFQQAHPEAVWRIPHGLGGNPSAVSLYDLSGVRFEAQVQVVDPNTVEVVFAEGLAIAGTAVILGSLPGFVPTPSSPGSNPLVFTQGTPASTWSLPHGLGRLPASIELYDSTGAKFDAQITATATTVTVTMDGGATAAGKAIVI
jgi:hypothetical protein